MSQAVIDARITCEHDVDETQVGVYTRRLHAAVASMHTRFSMKRLASAVALGIGSAVGTSAIAADAIHDWSGISAGVEAGIDHSRSKWSGDFSGSGPSRATLGKSSGTGSAFAGYTLQSGNLTYGAEVDYGFFAGSKSAQIDGGEGFVTTLESKPKSLGSARLKLGYAAGDTLFYATGGVAFGDFQNVLSTNGGFSETALEACRLGGGSRRGLRHRSTSGCPARRHVLRLRIEDVRRHRCQREEQRLYVPCGRRLQVLTERSRGHDRVSMGSFGRRCS